MEQSKPIPPPTLIPPPPAAAQKSNEKTQEVVPIRPQPSASGTSHGSQDAKSNNQEQPKNAEPSVASLQSTQKSHVSQETNSDVRAHHAPRDPRFPQLIPGTIEFLVAKGQYDANPADEINAQYSGPTDLSEHAKFLHP
uniref:Uncharacterized protein n=1 Tax=Panagrolaimus sp. PS1159 TaxID=55785 RepID=A0AC35GDE5_9BILA